MTTIERIDLPTDPALALIAEAGMLRLDKQHLTAELAALKVEHVVALMTNEDLVRILGETLAWIETASNGELPRDYERWTNRLPCPEDYRP